MNLPTELTEIIFLSLRLQDIVILREVCKEFFKLSDITYPKLLVVYFDAHAFQFIKDFLNRGLTTRCIYSFVGNVNKQFLKTIISVFGINKMRFCGYLRLEHNLNIVYTTHSHIAKRLWERNDCIVLAGLDSPIATLDIRGKRINVAENTDLYVLKRLFSSKFERMQFIRLCSIKLQNDEMKNSCRLN